MDPTRISIATILPLFLCGSALALQAPRAGQSTRLRVDWSGAHFVQAHGLAEPTPAAPKSSVPGLVWERSDGGLGWIATAVSIGDRGYQVFAEYDQNNQSAELLSCFDSNPPAPVWSDGAPLGTQGRSVAGADATDTKVAMNQLVVGGNPFTRQVVLRKYTSSSATPDWSYTFVPLVNSASHVAISRDGQTIVGALHDSTAAQFHIAVFGPGSGTPLSYTVLPAGATDSLRRIDLSADGSTLYYSSGVAAHIFDLAAQAEVFSTNIGASFDSHAISGDGSVFAFGNFNTLEVYEKVGGTYVSTYTETVPGQCYCAIIDISDDGSTIASGWTFYNNYLSVRVDAIDVATKTVAMSKTLTGGGSKQNVVADVSISADGQRFALGLWGDANGLVPECHVFARDSSTALVSLNLPGSVFDVDISADGARAVFGSKAVHANTMGSGGKVDLLAVGGEDLVLRNAPRIGATVHFDLHFRPGSVAFLAQSLGESAPPLVFPGVGTLFIELSSAFLWPAGVVPANGIATRSLPIPNAAILIGLALDYQGLSVPVPELSDDWIKMTILP